MNVTHWTVIGLLAVAAFAIRVVGLIAGNKLRASRHRWILDELPGLIVVSLVASSLAGQSAPSWIAAAFALAAAVATNHVIITMGVGLAVFAGITGLGL